MDQDPLERELDALLAALIVLVVLAMLAAVLLMPFQGGAIL